MSLPIFSCSVTLSCVFQTRMNVWRALHATACSTVLTLRGHTTVWVSGFQTYSPMHPPHIHTPTIHPAHLHLNTLTPHTWPFQIYLDNQWRIYTLKVTDEVNTKTTLHYLQENYKLFDCRPLLSSLKTIKMQILLIFILQS